MSNYLANLAARTFNLVPVVRPLVLGRFEPSPVQPKVPFDTVAPNPPETVEASLDWHEAETAPIPARTIPRRTRKSFVAAPAEDEEIPHSPSTDSISPKTNSMPARSSTAALTVRASGTRAPSPAPPVLQPLLTDAPEADRSAGVAPSRTEASKSSSTRQDRPAANTIVENFTGSARARQPAPAASVWPTETKTESSVPPVSSKQYEEPQASTFNPLSESESLTTRHQKTIVAREQLVVNHPMTQLDTASNRTTIRVANESQPRVAPARRGSLGDPFEIIQPSVKPLFEDRVKGFGLEERQAPPAEPVVHVTIGRIEIRAVQSQQSSAKRRATTPVMNLDDYLRRRSEGSGR
ncbi:MAG: hypothetical protein WAV47_00630 [Blastocatellia bacterium]